MNPGLIELVIKNPYTPVFLAVVLLLLVVVFVHLRQKKFSERNSKSTSLRSPSKPYDATGRKDFSSSNRITRNQTHQYNPKENISIESKQGSKVEEIRINIPKIDKKIVSIEHEKGKKRTKSFNKNITNRERDWFEGKDDIRHEIDKITGKIDEKDKDKWFEGMDNVRTKVDEKIKKIDKTKIR